MTDELFIFGDPRCLSGGASTRVTPDYELAPTRIGSGLGGPTVDNAMVAARLDGMKRDGVYDGTLHSVISRCGQSVHRGKAGYHHRPTINVFLNDRDKANRMPSVGVELETIARGGVDCRLLERDLWSNWFHFEHDGSLGDLGYECITEPLGPRYYRDLRLWEGLQNTLSPWLYSWNTDSTGLHVHVGFDTLFDNPIPAIPYDMVNRSDRTALARMIVLYVYYMLADQTLLDRVFLRQNRNYCGNTLTGTAMACLPTEEGVTARTITRRAWTAMAYPGAILNLYGFCLSEDGCQPGIRHLTDKIATPNRTLLTGGVPEQCEGHNAELNLAHKYTVEFRRGKGTLNATSIHRMVELTTGVVRYAGKILADPDMVPSSGDFHRFLASETTSESLAGMAGELIEKGN